MPFLIPFLRLSTWMGVDVTHSSAMQNTAKGGLTLYDGSWIQEMPDRQVTYRSMPKNVGGRRHLMLQILLTMSMMFVES